MVSKYVPPPPIKPTRSPEWAWQEIAVDLLGPLPTGEHLLVVVEYLSRWMEVDVLRSTISAAVIKCKGMACQLVYELIMVPIWCLRRWRNIWGNWDCASLRHTFVAQSQWRGWAPEPITYQSHESLPSRRGRLAARAQRVSTGLPMD